MVYLRASGDDMDEAAAMFTEQYKLSPVTFTRLTGEPFAWSHHATGDATMTLRTSRLVGTMETTIGSDDEVIIEMMRRGESTLQSGRREIELTVGTPFMVPSARSPMQVRTTDPESFLVHLDATFLRHVAEELPDVHFLGFVVGPPASDRASKIWRRAVDLVATVVFDPSIPPTALLSREMARLAAVATLHAFPYDSMDRAAASSGSEPVAVRGAFAYVYHNAHLPIGPSDIARAVGLSVRSLQYALRRYRETTPTRLLAFARLERVHEELLVADARTGSVAASARRWGFIHLGRFAGMYYERYSESPRDTLRRTGPASPAVKP